MYRCVNMGATLTVILVLFYIFCCVAEATRIHRYSILMLACCVLIFIVGFRSFEWPDTEVYAYAFQHHTNALFRYSMSDEPYGYEEGGFYFLSSIIRTFTSDYTIYFLIIGAITFVFIYKSLRVYCLYPLIGLCAYICHFFLGRNMMQIRAALAIAIIVYALRYVADRNFKKYFIYVVIGFLLHHSIILALPFYWFNKIPFSRKTICLAIVGAFVVAAVFSPLITNKVAVFTVAYDVATSYTAESSPYTAGKGLANPMIYYQVFILLVYTFLERKLAYVAPCYKTIRNGYLYSTIILIVMSPFLVLSARMSTIFATLEIFMIPAFFAAFKPKGKLLLFLGIGVVVAGFFYLNLMQ